jgi:hypothetical protein
MTEAKHTFRLSEVRNNLGWVLLLQIILLMTTATLLDGGYVSGICGSAMAGYWLMVGLLALRRRNALTKADTVLIRSGFFLWLVIAIVVCVALEQF